jgi:putative glycosyltransferase (TIGR04372 family)
MIDIMTCYNPWPFITKLLFHKGKNRFLSLREIFEYGLTSADQSFMFEAAGVEPICNTPEEIRTLAIEVDERMKGQWQPQPEDEELQQRFWDIFRQYTPKDRVGDIQARIGAVFLRKHVDLLN